MASKLVFRCALSILGRIWIWRRSFSFPNFDTIRFLLGWTKFGVSTHYLQNAWEAWPQKFDMLIYPDHHQNWLDVCHGRSLVFLILPQNVSSETRQMLYLRFCFRMVGKNGLNHSWGCPSSEIQIIFGMKSGNVNVTGAWASYQIRKIAVCACAGNAKNVFPPHHGLAIPTCITVRVWCDACRDR